ncbi:hypothetical protein PMI04_010010 [Sphingobium sp. AP49]|uniref:hypothetical protein n=1 Tax=Sphingobium sp. AP49 TaxID=1144307 RepID=UPI00026EE755|nr:hypothetical protein [Sphingobium sp. AP49]WHO40892.1 hypothetical protein PMI04_010010 [Sphingobium sp. AP49]
MGYVSPMDVKLIYKVRAGDVVIGSVALDHWDQFMGVAGGPFYPHEAYAPHLHATILDGVDLNEAGQRLPLNIVDSDDVQLNCEAVAIQDWASSVGDDAREVTIFGVESLPSFEGK